MGRVKVPQRLSFRVFGVAKDHDTPFHILATREGRFYLIGLDLNQAKDMHEKLGKAINEAEQIQPLNSPQ